MEFTYDLLVLGMSTIPVLMALRIFYRRVIYPAYRRNQLRYPDYATLSPKCRYNPEAEVWEYNIPLAHGSFRVEGALFTTRNRRKLYEDDPYRGRLFKW